MNDELEWVQSKSLISWKSKMFTWGYLRLKAERFAKILASMLDAFGAADSVKQNQISNG